MPNLFVVGAPKAGTTSLYKYLGKHPDVYFSHVKEPHFLYPKGAVNIPGAITDRREYERLYEASQGCSVVGDASVFGMLFYTEAIESILRNFGEDVAIIILLRNPAERAYSAYLQCRRYNENENREFMEAFMGVRSPESIPPMMRYKEGSLYCEAVKAYCSAFKRVKVLVSEEFFAEPEESLADGLAFLNLDPGAADFSALKVHNEGGRDLVSPVGKFLVKKLFTQKVRIRLKRIFPKIHAKAKAWFAAKFLNSAAPFSEDDYKAIYGHFEQDIECLGEVVGRDLKSIWPKAD